VPYLSASAVVIHYEEAQYQVYAPLPLLLPIYDISLPRCLFRVIHDTDYRVYWMATVWTVEGADWPWWVGVDFPAVGSQFSAVRLDFPSPVGQPTNTANVNVTVSPQSQSIGTRMALSTKHTSTNAGDPETLYPNQRRRKEV